MDDEEDVPCSSSSSVLAFKEENTISFLFFVRDFFLYFCRSVFSSSAVLDKQDKKLKNVISRTNYSSAVGKDETKRSL